MKAITLSGSIRKGSFNQLLQRDISARLAKRGVSVTDINLGDYPMPIFHADLETEGTPESAIALARMFVDADIVFIASPDYNGSVTPLLKNTIDWLSRQDGKPFSRAVFGVGGAAASQLSAVPSLNHLRDILIKLGALIVPVDVRIGPLKNMFDETGALVGEMAISRADMLADELVRLAAK